MLSDMFFTAEIAILRAVIKKSINKDSSVQINENRGKTTLFQITDGLYPNAERIITSIIIKIIILIKPP